MEQVAAKESLSGRPHLLTVFPPLLLPLSAAAVCFGLFMGNGSRSWLLLTLGAAASIIAVTGTALAVMRRTVCHWRMAEGMLYVTYGAVNRRELGFRLDRLLYAEIRQNPLTALLGCSRVRLYAPTDAKPFFSQLMAEREAAALVNRFAAATQEKPHEGNAHSQRLVSGKYAALLGAATARETLLPVGWSGICALYGMGNLTMAILAAALLTAGLLSLVMRLLREGGLEVAILPEGFAIQAGVWHRRKYFVPRRSVIGTVECAGPVSLLRGASRFELICEGGRRIPCMRWYEGGCGAEAAKRLLDCTGLALTHAADSAAFRRYYVGLTVAALLTGIPGGLLLLPLDGTMRRFASAALTAALLTALLHCMTALRFGEDSGIHIGAGTLSVGGMGLLSARRLTLRRGCLAAVKIRRGLRERMKGFCTAELIPKGTRRGGVCRQIPYDKLLAIVERFY